MRSAPPGLRDLAEVRRVAPAVGAKPEVVLSVSGLSDERRYADVSFDLRKGEIVGTAGLTMDEPKRGTTSSTKTEGYALLGEPPRRVSPSS